MSKKYRSDAMAAIHEMMEDLHQGGVIDKKTMRRFDDACLTPIRLVQSNIRIQGIFGTFNYQKVLQPRFASFRKSVEPASPQNSYCILFNLRVRRKNCHPMHDRLRNQHPIERIRVEPR